MPRDRRAFTNCGKRGRGLGSTKTFERSMRNVVTNHRPGGTMPAYLQLGAGADMLRGESRDSAHPGWIEVLSFHWGNQRAGIGAGTGTSNMPAVGGLHEIVVVKPVDVASAKLFEYCAKGKHIAQAVLDVPGNGAYAMTDVVIASMQAGGGTGGRGPSELVGLNFTSIKYGASPLAAAASAMAAGAMAAVVQAAAKQIVK
jgi:type VI protein secretion system component Hcp